MSIEAVLIRMAEALEKLSNDPEIEIEGGPPICPGCGKMNPMVNLPASDSGVGPLAEISFEAECQSCGSQMFVLPESYSMHKSRSTAVEEMQLRREQFSADV